MRGHAYVKFMDFAVKKVPKETDVPHSAQHLNLPLPMIDVVYMANIPIELMHLIDNFHRE